MNGKYYAGRIIYAEYCPVTDFREAKCRQYREGNCDRGGYCNFMHLKHVSKSQKKALARYMYEAYPQYKERRKQEEDEEYSRRDRDYEVKQEGRGRDEVKQEAPPREQTSEERRAMVAAWNQEEGI